MIFTFGAACRAADKIRNELNSKIGNLKAETAAANKINKRFHYFDGLKQLAATLTAEASGILDTAKDLRTKLEGTQRELLQDFTDDEIDDQLGDEDFANDFAEQLNDALTRLEVQCDITIKDCKERKDRLTHALIWADFGVDDKEAPKLIQLNENVEAKLLAQFFEHHGKDCNNFYGHASQKFAQDVEDYTSVITNLGKHKHVIMNYAQSEFHVVKGAIFNIVDGLIDS